MLRLDVKFNTVWCRSSEQRTVQAPSHCRAFIVSSRADTATVPQCVSGGTLSHLLVYARWNIEFSVNVDYIRHLPACGEAKRTPLGKFATSGETVVYGPSPAAWAIRGQCQWPLRVDHTGRLDTAQTDTCDTKLVTACLHGAIVNSHKPKIKQCLNRRSYNPARDLAGGVKVVETRAPARARCVDHTPRSAWRS